MFAVALAASLLLQLNTFEVSASSFTDFPSDWSAPALKNAVENGLLQGADGKINPTGQLTRAELATILTRAFGTTQQSSMAGFSDMQTNLWSYDALAEAVRAGFMQGSGNYMYPNQAVTRQETMVILARALKLEEKPSALSDFADASSVSNWAKGSVGAMVTAGYVKGNNGFIEPSAAITRSQFATIMSNITGTYVDTVQEYSTDVDGSIIVRASGVTLKDLTVGGDVILADGIGTGEATLSNVTVKGRVVIRGGGINSIHITNCQITGAVALDNTNGSTRVVLNNSTVGGNMLAYSDLNLEGNVDNLVLRESSTLNIKSGIVSNLQVEDGADSSKVNISAGATVTTASADAKGVEFAGSGKLGTVKIGADNASITVSGARVDVAKNVSGTKVNGKVIDGGTNNTTSSSTSSGSGSSKHGSGSSGGTNTGDFVGGAGTASDPYKISTATQLNAVRNNLTAHYELTSNIDLSGYNWNPIGKFAGTAEDPDMPDPSVAFTGSFDGNGFKISNLQITDTSTVRGVGVFGCMAGNGMIYDLVVENAKVSSTGQGVSAVVGMALQMNNEAIKNITLQGSNTISAAGMVGGIVGGGYCGMENCTATADILMTGSFATGSGQSAGVLAGGMTAGSPNCTITDCTVNGGTITVKAMDSGNTGAIGGLSGCATEYDEISGCKVSHVTIQVPDGAVMVGGLVGMGGKSTEGTYATAPKGYTLIEDCQVSVTIDAGETASRIGGIAGSGFYLGNEPYLSYYPVPAAMQIVDCIADGSIDGGKAVGSIIGYAFRNSVVTSCTGNMGALQQVGAVDAAKAVALENIDQPQTVGSILSGASSTTGTASSIDPVAFAGGSGTASDPYEITTAVQLDAVRNDLTAFYELTSDIDLSGYSSWNPIGQFAGTEEDPDMPDPSVAFTGGFNGNGFKISNLKITDTSTVRGIGIFGCMAGNGEIYNLVVENADISSTGQGVGAVVGMALQMNNGAIKNITLQGSNTISAAGMVGGIVGGGYCGMEGCIATADIIMAGSFAAGSGQSAGILAGGMTAGSADCEIINCIVKGGTITVTATDHGNTGAIGGLTGCATEYDEISGCTVSNVTIQVPDGSVMIGGLIGMGGKSTEGTYATAHKGFTLIEDCQVDVTIDAGETASRIGGIVGSGFYLGYEPYLSFYPVPAAIKIVDCSADGSIHGGESVGSIIGYAFRNSAVTSCTANMGDLQQVGAAEAAEAVRLSEIL